MTGVDFHLNEKNLWRMINVGFLACIGIFSGGSLLGIQSPGAVHFLCMAVVLLLLTVLGAVPLRFCWAGMAALAAVLAGAGAMIGFQNCFSFFRAYFEWLAGGTAWQQEQVMGYEVIQIILLTFICYFLQVILDKNFRLKIAAAVFFLAALLTALFGGSAASYPGLPRLEISRAGVAFLLCYMAVVYVEGTQRKWEKVRSKSLQKYMLWIMPFLGLYFFIMLLLPVPETPYDWRLVKGIYQQLRESFFKLSGNLSAGDGEDYDLTLSGFSENGELNGRLDKNENEIMTIRSKNGRAGSIYLLGKVYDTFDGRKWEQSGKGESRERFMDTAETLYAVTRYDREYMRDYLYRTDLEVSYRFFRTEYLFAPLKAWDLEYRNENLDFTEREGSLFLSKRSGYGTEYNVSYYRLNMGQEDFYRFLEEKPETDEETLERIFRDLERSTGVQLTREEMQRYRESIHERYLGDVTLSQKAEKYLADITKQAHTDMEKLRAIEEELSSFTYTRSPGDLPEAVIGEREFLDYFLFESREGYCNYFATAFVLLARAENIPARYVQGFCVPLNGNEETAVYSDMAHAWPEVYLEEIGWIPFEPTPGYAGLRYQPWRTRSSAETARASAGTFTERKEKQAGSGEEEREDPGVPLRENRRWRELFKAAGVVFLFALGAGAGILLLDGLLRRFRYRKMSDAEKFKSEVARNLRILSFMGIKRKEHETLEEYRERGRCLLEEKRNGSPGEKDVPAEMSDMEFVEIYEEFLYGRRVIDGQILNEIIRQRKDLTELLRKQRRWVYVYYRILAGWR